MIENTKRIVFSIVCACILLAGVIYVLIETDDFQLFGELISRVETDKKVVALTFDDGPKPGRTEEILEILAREKVPATFFLNGRNLEKHPALGRLIVENGHEIGNHSYSHPRMIFMSYTEVSRQVESTTSAIRELGYEGPIHFRPPYGKKLLTLPFYLWRNNIKTIIWDVEPETWDEPRNTAMQRVEVAVEKTKPGSIILLHVMYGDEQSMIATPIIIRELKQKGFRFVAVSDLIAIK